LLLDRHYHSPFSFQLRPSAGHVEPPSQNAAAICGGLFIASIRGLDQKTADSKGVKWLAALHSRTQ
jgi:hypothetical protein